MKKILMLSLVVISLVAGLLIGGSTVKLSEAQANDKDLGNSLPDPDRPFYDGEGNKYDYQGNIIEPAPTSAPAPAPTTPSNCH